MMMVIDMKNTFLFCGRGWHPRLAVPVGRGDVGGILRFEDDDDNDDNG